MPDDPAAAAILETKPSTPGECIRAAKILSDLKQPDLAKRFHSQAEDQHLSCPLYRQACRRLIPAPAYPVQDYVSGRGIPPQAAHKIPQFSLN